MANKLTWGENQDLEKALREGRNVTDIARMLGRSTSTIYRHLNRSKKVHGNAGEFNSQSKLRVSDVQDIRKQAKEGVSIPKIAKQYQVSKETIYQIVARKTWAHIA